MAESTPRITSYNVCYTKLLRFFGASVTSARAAVAPPEDERQRRVWESLGAEPLASEEIAQRCGLTPQELSDILLHLELSGGVLQYPGMRFARRTNA